MSSHYSVILGRLTYYRDVLHILKLLRSQIAVVQHRRLYNYYESMLSCMLLSDTRCVDDPYAEFQVDDDLLSCDDIVSLNPYSCREVNQSCCASCAKYGTADIHVPHQSFKNCVYSDVAAVWHT